MPYQASDGREPVPGMQNAYYATPQDLQTYHDAATRLSGMRVDLPEFDITGNPNRYVFVAAFDGTGNDATRTLTESTNVHALYDDFDRFIHGDGPNSPGFSRMHARYIEGPGTQNTWGNTLDNARGNSVEDRVWEMYKDLGDKTRQWKQENPDAEISVITFGFSRGAVEAAEFASVVGKYGIHAEVGYRTQENDDHRHDTRDPMMGDLPDIRQFRELSGELVAPGKVPIVAGLYDPVATGIAEQHDRALPANITSALQLTARDEHRVLFPVNRIVTDDIVRSDPDRFANIAVAGCHSDVGGGYDAGKGLAQINANLMGDYLNKVVGHEICKKVAPDPEQYVVHDSNTKMFQRLGYAQTQYWYADRTQDGNTVQQGQHVRSGVDPNIIGKAMPALDSVHTHPGGSVDDNFRPAPSGVESRLDARANDAHTPKPHDATYALESTQRQIDPTKLLLESSTRIASMMDEKTNPHAAEILRGAAGESEVRHSILSVGDSAAGRLSAAVALAAKDAGMDRIGEITFDRDRNALVIADRRDTHGNLVRHAAVDIDDALRAPMRDSLHALDANLFAQNGPRAPTLYAQAHQQLSALGGAVQDPEALVLGAERIASQARGNGLTAIEALTVVEHDGRNAVVASQLDPQQGLRYTQPVDATQFVQQPQVAQHQAQDPQAQAQHHHM